MDIHTFIYIVIFSIVLAMVAWVWSVVYLTKAVINFIKKEYRSDSSN